LYFFFADITGNIEDRGGVALGGQNKKQLKIFTLGKFQVFSGEENLTKKHPKSRKPWLLFQFLLTNAGKALPSEIIVGTLWPDINYENPHHSLRNLVYRLRNKLKDEGNGERYIIQAQGNYSFNTRSNYWCDFEELEQLSERAFSLEDKDPQKIELLEKAYQLYGGEFLPSRPYEEWTVNLRIYCQRIFLKVVVELSRLYKERKQWEKNISLCEKALEFEPFEENLHWSYVLSLIKSDQKARAKNHFHQTNTLFQKELGVELGFDIDELINNHKNIEPKNSSTTWGDFQEVLEEKEEDKGAFLCDSENFRMIYQLEERRAERNIRKSSIASLQLIAPKGKKIAEEQLNEKSNVLQGVLLNSLRRGDVICPNKPGEFFLLLVDIPPDKVDKVLNRIAAKYYENSPDDELRMNVRHRPLLRGGTI